jgi:hypothetical protein
MHNRRCTGKGRAVYLYCGLDAGGIAETARTRGDLAQLRGWRILELNPRRGVWKEAEPRLEEFAGVEEDRRTRGRGLGPGMQKRASGAG